MTETSARRSNYLYRISDKTHLSPEKPPRSVVVANIPAV